MRILHVISTLALSSGGPTRVICELSKKQVQLGLSVAICSTDRANPVSQKINVNRMRSMLGDAVNLHLFHAELPALLYSTGMRRWLIENKDKFDIVHVHGLYRFPPSFAALLMKKGGKPYIIQPHGNLDPYLHKRSTAGSILLKRLWERLFDLRNLHGASAIHFTTEDERERASFLKLRASSFVVPNGLDWSQYEVLPKEGVFRARVQAEGRPLVLFLGRLHFKKGLDLLIPAIARVRTEYPDALLAIVGPDNEGYGEKVRTWVRERNLENCVRFVEHLDGEAVREAYVDADVFVLPSYTENFGMTVAESLACGTPVVISDQVNIHQEVAASGAGLVTRCDVAEIAEAIGALLKDGWRRQAMGEAGRALVKRKWTWDVVAGQLTREYEKILLRHKTGQAEGVRGAR